MADLRAAPASESSQPSTRYMPAVSLMKSWRRSKFSSTSRQKPSGLTACHVLAAMPLKSLIENRRALPIHISSSIRTSSSLTCF